jgi:hypothetical protein
MPSSPFSKNCKPPKPPILVSLSGVLSVEKTPINRILGGIQWDFFPKVNIRVGFHVIFF